MSDIDGVLRGKYLHKDKFFSAVDGGFGFCDVVFGWDTNDQCYDNTTLTGWQNGFPDALASIDLATYRTVPWDDDVPFFLGEFVAQKNGKEVPHPICPAPGAEARAQARRETGLACRCAAWSSSGSISPRRRSRGPKRITSAADDHAGDVRLLAAARDANRDFLQALMVECGAFGIPIEGLHTETGPGVYEVAILFSEALEAADRAILFKTAAKEIGSRFGIMPSFMAKWSPPYPGCSGHIHQSLSDGKKNLFYDAKDTERHQQALRELPRRPGRRTDGIRADVLADDQQLQAPGRRILGAGETDLGARQSHRELSRDRRVAESDATGDALPGRRHESVPRRCRVHRRRPVRCREEPQAHGKADHRHQRGRRAHSARAAHADRDDAELPASKLARDWFGDDFVDHFAATREWEWRQWLDAVTDWELKRYFEII